MLTFPSGQRFDLLTESTSTFTFTLTFNGAEHKNQMLAICTKLTFVNMEDKISGIIITLMTLLQLILEQKHEKMIIILIITVKKCSIE